MAEPHPLEPLPECDSYVKYIEAICGKPAEVLAAYFRKGFMIYDSLPRPRSEPTKLYVTDSVRGLLHNHSFQVSSQAALDHVSQFGAGEHHFDVDEQERQFVDFLKTSSSSIQTRLVMVRAPQMADISFPCLAAIGLQYKIHPSFFAAHLEQCQALVRPEVTRQQLVPSPLPSQRRYLQIFATDDSFMTMLMKTWNDMCLVVLLEHAPTHPNPSLQMHEYLQRTHNQDEIRALDAKPLDYLLPYLLNLAGKSAHATERAVRIGSRRIFENDWMNNQANHRHMIASRKSLSRFLDLPEVADRATLPKFETLLNDYGSMIEDASIVGLDIQGSLQQQANNAAIEETQRGLKQGESIRRLTLVAFVFIPLNFATSFFGMNFYQLGNGTLNLAWFFLLAVLATLLSFVLSVSVRPLDSIWRRARAHHAAMEIIYSKREMDRISKGQILLGFLLRPIKHQWQNVTWELHEEGKYPAYSPKTIPVRLILLYKYVTVPYTRFMTWLHSRRKNPSEVNSDVDESRP